MVEELQPKTRQRPQTVEDADDPGRRGSLVIADKVIERLATIAAREMDEVTRTGGRWTASPLATLGSLGANRLPHATAQVAGGRARIRVDVAAPWPSSASEVARRVREHVATQVSALAGIKVDAVDVTVAQMTRPRTNDRRVS